MSSHKALEAYSAALRQIEFAEICISVLERMHGATAERCIKQLKAEQQRALRHIDSNAAKLDAPYPGSQP